MISAKEIREITAKGREERFKKDLKAIENLIRNSAEAGDNYVVYFDCINDEVRKELEAAGYTVENYPRIINYVYVSGYKISW